jgi:hypothetical protein
MNDKIIHHLEYPKDVDRMMVPLLDALNSIPGCRTMYSCDGHGWSQFYVAMAVCSKKVHDAVARWARRNIPDVEVVSDYQTDTPSCGYCVMGRTEYERSMGIYSVGIGEMKYGKRKRTIGRLVESLMPLVPDNLW